MYHWRVLPDSAPLPEELADIERAVAYWGGGSQVRRRIQALQQSPASVALFLEYIPQNLHQWLGTQVEAGDQAANRACAMAERELAAGTSFMISRGLLHFDAHFENILTDGQRLYFADYGLAISSGFELSQDEADFFDRHQTYDRCYTATYLVNWLVTALYGYQREDREGRHALVRAYAEGKRPTGIPEEAAAILARHAPIAAVMSDFNHKFQRQSRQTPYPLEEIRQLGGMYSSSIADGRTEAGARHESVTLVDRQQHPRARRWPGHARIRHQTRATARTMNYSSRVSHPLSPAWGWWGMPRGLGKVSAGRQRDAARGR